MRTKSVNIEDLKHDKENVRKHNVKNIRAIQNSLEAFGQQKPIVIDKDNVVVAGNGTLEAARNLGWKKLQCVVSDLTPKNLEAFAIADNRTAELAEWNVELLNAKLVKLSEIGFEVETIGFTIKDIEVIGHGRHTSDVEGAKEISEEDFQEFEHTCPKCGFEFDD